MEKCKKKYSKNSQKIKLFFIRIEILLQLGVPDNQILLHFGVTDNQILRRFAVPANQILLHFSVPDKCSSGPGMARRMYALSSCREHRNGVIFGCWGHRNEVKFGCREH